jgi:3-methyl-2-oxobutanoate hydroxymethyltransferase
MRITVPRILEMTRQGERIAVLTAYDYPSARLVDAAGVHVILVGDSLGNVVLGYDGTLPVTMDEMIHHAAAVARGTAHALVVGDMPFMSYQASEEEAIRNAGRFLKEAGCQAVKLEGGRTVAPLIRKLVDYGIPVMGHVGLTPQSVHRFGGYRVQGRTASQAEALLADALAVQEAGAFSVVLELMAAPVARTISEHLDIPTIGIGAGPHCDGQVLVFHDMLGMDPSFQPRHAKRYADVGETISGAVRDYVEDVRTGAFPAEAHSFTMSADEESRLGQLPPVPGALRRVDDSGLRA